MQSTSFLDKHIIMNNDIAIVDNEYVIQFTTSNDLFSQVSKLVQANKVRYTYDRLFEEEQ